MAPAQSARPRPAVRPYRQARPHLATRSPGPALSTPARLLCGLLLLSALLSKPARATDEIQVYDATIAAVGQWTLDQHLNYVVEGHDQPAFPGGLPSNHTLNGTPEPAYGLADWWEIGFYAPFSIQSGGRYYGDGFKVRTLFVTPHAADRPLFGGINFECSYETPRFSETRFGLEIRPILGVRGDRWEAIFNPIVDVGFGSHGEADFAPAMRVARRLASDTYVAVEYYGDWGRLAALPPTPQQQHTLFGVGDFRIGAVDVELGLGYGLTASSDRLVVKAILGYAFAAPQSSRQTPVSLHRDIEAEPL